MKTAIIIPSFNESQNIGKLIAAIYKTLPLTFIIVVDDNSPDNTSGLVEELKVKYPKLHLIIRKNERGRGSAVIRGLEYAKKNIKPDLYIEMDADFSHDPKELPLLIKNSLPGNFVIGSRYVPGAKIVNWPFGRLISSWIANLLIRSVLNLTIRDNTNGYRVYPPKAVEVLLNHHFVSSGYINLTEISYVLIKNNFKFIEVPTVFTNRIAGKSNANFKEFFKSITNLFLIKSS